MCQIYLSQMPSELRSSCTYFSHQNKVSIFSFIYNNIIPILYDLKHTSNIVAIPIRETEIYPDNFSTNHDRLDQKMHGFDFKRLTKSL